MIVVSCNLLAANAMIDSYLLVNKITDVNYQLFATNNLKTEIFSISGFTITSFNISTKYNYFSINAIIK